MTDERKVGPFRLEAMTRDQVERFREVLAGIRPPRRRYHMQIEHAVGCPCAAGRPPDVCTCATVDVVCTVLQ